MFVILLLHVFLFLWSLLICGIWGLASEKFKIRLSEIEFESDFSNFIIH